MIAKYAPGMAALFVFLSSSLTPSMAQLPPTNMGKYVHQPGDNQYTDATQSERHGVPGYRPDLTGRPIIARPQVQYIMPATPPPKRPDISIEPIASDEPVPPAGFPPLPDRLDLPIASSSGWKNGGSFTSDSGGGGGGGGGGAPSGPPQPTFHQHYGHVAPGAYLTPQQRSSPQGSGGGSSDAAPGMSGPNTSGGHGYYKAQTPPPIQKQSNGYYKARTPGGDYYNANTGGDPGMSPPKYTGASAKDLKNLGREPKLNDRDEQNGGSPEAPQPVTVNQATTQDLSLPEDEFTYRANQPNRTGKAITRGVTRMIKAPLNSVGGMAGIHF